MLRLAEGRSVVLITGYTDLRAGIDRLAGLVKTRYELDPFANTLYLFCGRKANRCKGLYWDDDRGFVLVCMRLEKGHMQWPRGEQEAMELNETQYRRLMEGYTIREKSTIGKVTRKDIM